ncbi:hypothetical protein DCAR_0519894 [Daucus carota subsp. sativus]|uniref:TF-B3 domain-containing protein n=1 Tax=Daucus carota subsp. sativus TaxID=79200 RepID=A0A162A2J5_DAUCS|nr:hypothetical protein DCAR_0519894 [Daucus carota subsp. sativus]
MLVFVFDGSSHFNVYVIVTDLSEIEYPRVAHQLQQTRPRDVNVQKGGLKFVNFVKDEEPLFDEFDLGITMVSVFDDHFVEYLFTGTPVSRGLNSHNPVVRFRIEITVQPHHLYRYIYGVVRSRGGKSRRTTIHDGWIQFRDDLNLRLGVAVVLECADNFCTHFAVQVTRNDSA